LVRISKTTSNGYVRLVLEVNETSTSKENNTSTVSWQLWLERASSWVYDLYNESLAEVEINGQAILSKYVSFDLRDSSWVIFGSGTLTIPHNDDGSKSIAIRARLTNVAAFGDIGWFSGNVDLSTIPRASEIRSVSSSELGKLITVNIDKKAAAFRHQVWWSVNGSDWIDLGRNHDTSVQFTVPIEYANRITNSDTGTVDVCVRTLQGDTTIGRDVYLNGTSILVPKNIVPTLDSITASEQVAKIAEIIPKGNFVKGKSTIRLEAVGAKGAYGSSIVSTELSLGNLVVRSSQGDFPANNSGTVTAVAKATDSRGRTATKSIQVNVIDYYAPKILAFLANRAGNGTNKTIISTVLANVSPLIVNDSNINRYNLKIQYSEKNSNRWLDAVNLTAQTVEKINRQIDSGAYYALDKSYNIRLVIQDRVSEIVDSVLTVRSSEVLVALGDGRIGFGGFPELKKGCEFFKPATMHNSLNVEGGILSNGKPIQEFAITSRDGKSIKFAGDLNNLKTAGGYYAYRVTNAPQGVDNTGYVSVITQDITYNCVQMYVPANKDAMYMRRYYANAWSGWIAACGEVDTWHNATYRNNWRTAGDGVVQYTKTADGTVYIRGVATGGSLDENAAIINLPVGYRPSKYMYKKALNNSYQTAIVGIDTNGNVTVKSKNVDDQWLCLDDISFKI
jgi:prophage lambdaSa04, minor structural protein